MTSRTLTPKEFSAALSAEFGVNRSPRWVCARCALYLQTKGKRGIAVVLGSRPYLIPGSELERFHKPLVFAARVA